MATHNTLKQGSRGDEVKKLQNSLLSAGYDLGSSGADGIYGAKTQAAVTKYQQDNGLVADGIAGEKTLGSLYVGAPSMDANTQQGENVQGGASAGTQIGGSQAQTTPAVTPNTSYNPNADEAYLNALSALQAAEKQAPYYANTYQGQLEDLYDRIVNRDKFAYDINTDALYQSMRDQYILGGQQAMRDTMGQAAALTGGYGNSYAQMVGQQTYDNYLKNLNDMVPELRGMALDAYNAEGDTMLQQYGMLGDLADDEYGKYSDAYNRWLTERDYLRGQVDDAYDRGLDKWEMDRTTMAENRENLMYLITASGYNPTDDEIAAAGMTRPQVDALLRQQAVESAGSVGGSRGGNGGDYVDGAGNEATTGKVDANTADKLKAYATGMRGDVGYTSSFEQTTGSLRYDNPGTLFTPQQLKGLRQTISMQRGVEGRCAIIDDALNEGKITGKTASQLLKDYGITEQEFKTLRGYK